MREIGETKTKKGRENQGKGIRGREEIRKRQKTKETKRRRAMKKQQIGRGRRNDETSAYARAYRKDLACGRFKEEHSLRLVHHRGNHDPDVRSNRVVGRSCLTDADIGWHIHPNQ